MKTVVRWSALLLFFAAMVVTAEDVIARGPVLRLSDNQVIGFERMLEEIRGIRLVFVGEVHNNNEHHQSQLAIIKALHETGKKFTIGLEMFTADSQVELDRWVSGKQDESYFTKIYNLQWNIPWPYYRDIFLYARDNGIQLIGLNVQREIIRKVALEGFAALTQDEMKMIPAGITCNVDRGYMAFIRKAYAMGHVANDKSFEHFCEAQMLWNKSLARNLEAFLARNPGRTVIVLTGLGHAMKRGTPQELLRDTGNGFKVLLPEHLGLDRRTVSSEECDYLLLSSPTGPN